MRPSRLIPIAVLAFAAACDTTTTPTDTTTAPTSVGGPEFAISRTIDPTNAPTGTHFQVGDATCTVNGLTVSCSSYELAGVGGSDAEATLDVSYTATVDCRNNGGKIVPVKAQVEEAPVSTGEIEAKNGRLAVPALSTGTAPSPADFEAQATCPNGNWTKEVRSGSITLSSFTYELTFDGFADPFITITGP
jgi:hypothetical protein